MNKATKQRIRREWFRDNKGKLIYFGMLVLYIVATTVAVLMATQ